MDNFALGITLMVVGMVTVFAILLIVIYLSRLLIAAINRFAPDESALVKRQSQTGEVSPAVMRVIAATVGKLTGGQGAVKSVEKL